jgi:ADP-heptose:LPS heptosyltransferase
MSLPLFMAVLKRARALVTPDTGPMHIAAGLGVPLVALFGPSSPAQWSPLTRNCRVIIMDGCQCDMILHDCQSATPCMARITPARVLENLQDILAS